MHPHIKYLADIASKTERLAIGLMSGTSLDGLDIALCKIGGSGKATQIDVIAFKTVDYTDAEKSKIREIFSKRTVDLEALCILNPWIGLKHGEMINDCLNSWNIDARKVDYIASHGQTIYHAPKSLHGRPNDPNATLQIGDGDHIAVQTGILTISDFRQKHIAGGGEGAPLAVYGDTLIFGSETEDRILLNFGGIANLTYLPKSRHPEHVFSSDVGPGNTLMDAFIQTLDMGLAYDKNGALARTGRVNEALLSALMAHTFFDQPLPKTTGPELFNLAYLEAAQKASRTELIDAPDIMATLNRFSAEMVTKALAPLMERTPNMALYASGGGAHNPVLMENLATQLPGMSVSSTADLGIDPDAKEAVLFALLGNETLCGQADSIGNGRENIPALTMGKISFPD